MYVAIPYTRGAHIPRLLCIKKYLNNHFAMYTRLTRFRTHVELASPAYLGLTEEGTDFWPKNRFSFYRFKLFFSPFSTQKPIPNVKIFI